MAKLKTVCGSPKRSSQALCDIASILATSNALRMLCDPSLSMFVYFSSVVGENAPQFGSLFFETAITEFTIMSFVCCFQAAEYGVVDLFMTDCLQALE